jgi:hypothetical protein
MHDVVRATGDTIQLTVWPEDFIIDPDPAPPGTGTGPRPAAAGDVLIVAALPDPVGTDRGHELVTLLNVTAKPIDLAGWGLLDGANGRTTLSGVLAGGATVQVTTSAATALGNRGDRILVVDPAGTTIDQTAYRANQVRPGRTICFGR